MMPGPRRPRNRNRNRGVGNSIDNMITGGTKDLKPQLLSFYCQESGNDTTTVATQALPVLRNFSSGPGRAQVVEVLKVFWRSNITTETDVLIQGALCTKNPGVAAAIAFSDPSVLDAWYEDGRITTSGFVLRTHPVIHDLTDGAGNGILVAVDNLYLQVASSGTSSTARIDVKILYRIAGASVQEYVGIVQSQQ